MLPCPLSRLICILCPAIDVSTIRSVSYSVISFLLGSSCFRHADIFFCLGFLLSTNIYFGADMEYEAGQVSL